MAAFCVAFMVYPIHYSVEVRNYSLVMFLSIIASFFLLEILRSHGNIPAILGLGFVNVCGLYTHYHYLFLILAHGVFIMCAFYKRRDLRLLRDWIPSLFITVIGFIPWIPKLIAQSRIAFINWLPHPTPMSLVDMPLRHFLFFMCLNDPGVYTVAGLVMIIPIAVVVIRLKRGDKGLTTIGGSALLLQLAILFIPPIAAYLVSVFYRPVFFHRYLIFSFPALIILIAAGITRMRDRNVAALLMVILLVPNMFITLSIINHRFKPDWDNAFKIVEEKIHADTLIVVHHECIGYALEEYGINQTPWIPSTKILTRLNKQVEKPGNKDKTIDIIALLFDNHLDVSSYTQLNKLENWAGHIDTTTESGLMIQYYRDVEPGSEHEHNLLRSEP